jgi:hypothetical protein
VIIKQLTTKAYGEVELYLHKFLTSEPDITKWYVSRWVHVENKAGWAPNWSRHPDERSPALPATVFTELLHCNNIRWRVKLWTFSLRRPVVCSLLLLLFSRVLYYAYVRYIVPGLVSAVNELREQRKFKSQRIYTENLCIRIVYIQYNIHIFFAKIFKVAFFFTFLWYLTNSFRWNQHTVSLKKRAEWTGSMIHSSIHVEKAGFSRSSARSLHGTC